MNTGRPITVYLWFPAESVEPTMAFPVLMPKLKLILRCGWSWGKESVIICHLLAGCYRAVYRPVSMVGLGQRGIEENRRLLALLTSYGAVHFQRSVEEDLPELFRRF